MPRVLCFPLLALLVVALPAPAAGRGPAGQDARAASEATSSGRDGHGRDDEGVAPAPDVLFWVIDTCRADRLGPWGHERPTSPFLDRLAAEGVVFERCFSQAPWTKPSMASLLTSHYPSATGVTKLFDRLDPSFVTLPEVLKEAGWYTAGFSANPIMGRWMSNLAQGFRWFTECNQVLPNGDPIAHSSGSAATLLPHVLRWLDRDPPRPLFLFVHSVDPHEEYRPAPEYLELFADPAREERYRREWILLKEAHGLVGNYCTQSIFDAVGVEAAQFLEYGRALYDADVLANDAAMARLWERFEAQGLLENLVVVVTSDHGEEFFEHGGTTHGHSLYNEMLHVPLVLWAPGLLPAGLRFGEPVRLLDVYPTLVDLLDLEVPAGLQGRSLLPWIEAGRATDAQAVLAEKHEDPTFSVLATGGDPAVRFTMGTALSQIRGPWKYILNLEAPTGLERPRHELYHLGRDPGETTNVADDHPALVERFEQEVLEQAAANQQRRVDPGASDPATLDPKILEALRALGYIK